MFAANMSGTEWMDPLRVALLMKAQPSHTAEAGIVAYFDKLIQQVGCLVEGSCRLSKEILPEAIFLAVKIRNQQSLKQSFEKVSTYEQVSPDLAKELLQVIEADAD